MNYSNEEKQSILKDKTEIAKDIKKLWFSFRDSGGGQSGCVCFDCFGSWLRREHADILPQLASSWCYFFDFIEGEGELRPEWNSWSKVKEMVGMPDFAVAFTLSPWPDGGWITSITLIDPEYAEDQGLLASKLKYDHEANWNIVEGFSGGLTAHGSDVNEAIDNLYNELKKL